MNKSEACSPPHTIHKRKQSQRVFNDLDNVDRVPSNVQISHQEALLYVFEDNEAMIKMIMKGRSPSMRHVSRTHRVALDWLFDRINLDPKIQIKYIDTKNQLADMLTKGNFTRDEWNHLLCLFNISHFSSINSLETMSKRTQKDSGEERVTAKLKPMMNSVSRLKDPNVLASTASESPVKTKSESQNVPLSSLNVQQTSTGRLVLVDQKEEHDIDFRVPGLSHAEAEHLRVQELVKRIENHPHREALHADLQQNNVYNSISKSSKAMIRE